uniref:Transcription initiation factor TFIID subunit 10 n=1 Tax=Rhabditophanes sp. KR3021 TaxID=114890 RepID=A0AC35TLV3_9BILA
MSQNSNNPIDHHIQSLIPIGIPEKVLSEMEELPVGALCILGKELLAELTKKVAYLIIQLKLNLDKKNTVSPELYNHIYTTKYLFAKIQEVRYVIEMKMKNSKVIEAEDYLDFLTNPNPPNTSDSLLKAFDSYESCRKKLVHLSMALKHEKWVADATDPRKLPKPDVLKNS